MEKNLPSKTLQVHLKVNFEPWALPESRQAFDVVVACEKALWGALTAGREKEGELATTSLSLSVCACDCLIGSGL